MVSKKLIEALSRLKPEIHPQEFLKEDTCVAVINSIVEEKERILKGDMSGHMSEAEVKLTTRVKLLQEELRLALGAGEDIKALKIKAAHIMSQFTREKEHALNAVTKQKEAEKRALMLVNHTEKLMKCLKMEAAAKMHVLETNRKERKYVDNEEFMVCLCVHTESLLIMQAL